MAMGQDNAMHGFQSILFDEQLPCPVLTFDLFNMPLDQLAGCAFGLSRQNVNQRWFVDQLGVIRLSLHAPFGSVQQLIRAPA